MQPMEKLGINGDFRQTMFDQPSDFRIPYFQTYPDL